MANASASNKPVIYTVAVISVFAVMGLFFCLYDRLAGKSYHAAITKVERSKTIVESMFPSHVRDRVLNDRSGLTLSKRGEGGPESFDPLQRSRHGLQNKPIADLHPNVTVLFADIANFTVRKS